MIIGIDASRAVSTQRTGTEGYAYFLTRALLPLMSLRGHQARLYFNEPPPPGLFPPMPDLKAVVIPSRRLWTHVRLAWELRQRPPDLFFTPAHVIPWHYAGRSVATVHDLGYHYYPQTHTWSQLAYLKWSTRHNGRVSHRLIADSEVTKRDLIHFYHVPPAKIQVVYPGIDPAVQLVTEEAEIQRVLQTYQVHPPYLLYLSTLQPRKNLLRLIRAYAQSGVPHQLVIAGKKGWLAQPILEELFRLPLEVSRKIILPGFVPEQDKSALITGATALLYPSLYEGFGFPLIEAQVCGTPVLAANSSSLPEIAGEGALLIDPLDVAAIAEGIRQLTRDPLLRYELAQSGLENARRFTWERAAEMVMAVLETAVLRQV